MTVESKSHQQPIIIAEVGVNHNGSISIAKQLIDVAVSAGADIVKFQSFKATELVTSQASLASYQIENTKSDQSQLSMLKELELSADQFKELSEYCEVSGIEFLSTAFDKFSLDFLIDLGVKRVKVPSGELTNFPYLVYVAAKRLPVILSTGMATLDEVYQSADVLVKNGLPNGHLTILHCTSNYPAKPNELNMLAMKTLKKELDFRIGYSDHSLGENAAIMAVALGAQIIEKHITLDRKMPGPDHLASMEPIDFKNYVSAIRRAFASMGDGIKKPSITEVENALLVRKSIVASRAIQEGEKFSENNITTKRPGSGLSPMLWEHVIGKRAIRNFSVDDMIEI